MATANKQTHEVDDGQVDLDFDEYEETVVTPGDTEEEKQVANKEPIDEISVNNLNDNSKKTLIFFISI